MTETLDTPQLAALPPARELVEPVLNRFQSEYNLGDYTRIDFWNSICSDPDPSVALSWDRNGVAYSIRVFRIADQLRLIGYAWTDGPDYRLWRNQDMGIVRHVGVPGIPWEDYLYEFVKNAYYTVSTWDVSTFPQKAPYVDDYSVEQLVIGSKLRPGFPVVRFLSEKQRRLSSTYFLWSEIIISIVAVLASIVPYGSPLIVLFCLGQIYLLNRYAQTRRPRSAKMWRW